MNKKVIAHIGAVGTAFILVWSGLTLVSPNLVEYYQHHLTLEQEYQKTVVPLHQTLQSGEIVVFGSSELTKPMHFRADSFLTDRNFPVSFSGAPYRQCFSIYSKLATHYTTTIRDEARIVVILSPRWFTRDKEGMKMQYFLEDMTIPMMYELYINSEVDTTTKLRVSKYIERHKCEIKPLTFVYKYALRYSKERAFESPLDGIVRQVLQTANLSFDTSISRISYSNQQLNYDSLKMIALQIEEQLSHNSFHVRDTFYEERKKTLNLNQQFPLALPTPFPLTDNQEYQDLLALIELLKTYKNPPLFVLLGLNPYTYGPSREEYIRPLYDSISELLHEAHFGVVDFWAKDTADYHNGSYIDDNHPGEVYWVQLDSALVEYFGKKEDIK